MWKNLFNLKNVIIAVLIGIILWQTFVVIPNKVKGDTVYIEGKPYEVVKHTVDTVYKWRDKIVFKDGSKIASSGAYGMKDYPTYIIEKGKAYADTRKKLYHIRHAKDKSLNSYYSKKILW